MEKVVITVLGKDRPGIVAEIGSVLAEQGFNIEDVSQTIVQSQFAGIFIASAPAAKGPNSEEASDRLLEGILEKRFAGQAIHAWCYPLENGEAASGCSGAGAGCEPFVITTMGPDHVGLVSTIAGTLAEHGVNIVNLKATFRAEDRSRVIMIYEVDVPAAVDRRAFRDALYAKAEAMGHELSLQHRNIFEIIHHV